MILNEEELVDEGVDLINDNLEDLIPIFADNIDILENNNEVPEHDQDIEPEEDVDPEDLVAQASREVLFDINSEPDLLDDFDIPANQDDIPNSRMANIVLVGIGCLNDQQRPEEVMIQSNLNSFPDWLLQILGSQIEPIPINEMGPHFYCQGDGLGVHPPVVAVEVDEDADNETNTSEDTSSTNTVDYAEVDPGPSDMYDMSSLPEETPSDAEDHTLCSNDTRLEFHLSTIRSDCISFISDILVEAVQHVEQRLASNTSEALESHDSSATEDYHSASEQSTVFRSLNESEVFSANDSEYFDTRSFEY